MFGIGMQELLLILIVVLLIFGANKLPEIGGGLGRAIRNFRRASSEPDEIDITPRQGQKAHLGRRCSQSVEDPAMKAEQLSVFLENRAGRLAEVTHTLAEAGVNIRALSLADTSDFGILRLIVDDQEKAKSVLKEHSFTLGRTSVVAVQVPDTPGGLDSVLQFVSQHGINVEYMYAFITREADCAIMIFRFDKTDQAVDLLKSNGFTVLPPDQLFGNKD